MSNKSKQIRVTLKKSTIGALPDHKLCVKGLGLRRIGHVVTLENTLAVMGMVRKVSHLLHVEEI